MKIKITRSDGTIIEAEGTVEECGRLAGAFPPPAIQFQYPFIFRWVEPQVPVYPPPFTSPIYPWTPSPVYPLGPIYIGDPPGTTGFGTIVCNTPNPNGIWNPVVSQDS
jgi:hypothetical protein